MRARKATLAMKNNFITRILKEHVGELNNVTWPTRKQAIHSMIVVLVIMLLTALFLGLVDYGLNELVLKLLNR